MLIRDCAGGVIFFQDKVFLIMNEKNEWVMPKGLIKEGENPQDAAVRRVYEETGITGKVIGQAGRTYYEFYSITRQKPVCNRIVWYIMETDNSEFNITEPEKYSEGGFFSISEAVEKVTYSQDKSLLLQSYKRYCEKKGKDSGY